MQMGMRDGYPDSTDGMQTGIPLGWWRRIQYGLPLVLSKHTKQTGPQALFQGPQGCVCAEHLSAVCLCI